MKENLLLDTDSYKASHWLQYPPGTQGLYSYLESRGGRYAETLFFGLQYLMKEYLSKPITQEMIDEASDFFEAHGEPFNHAGWQHILEKHDGFLPIKIRAIPEGLVVPHGNVLMTCESTDPAVFWISSYIETVLMRMWYPITVATRSMFIKRIINKALLETSDNPAQEIGFKLHDFGARGVSSRESAGIGGMSHLVNFQGSDTVIGVRFANEYYKAKMAAFSIPAAEHSTITSWGRENEADAYENMLTQYARPNSLVAVVSDSYNLWNAISNIWGGSLKKKVIDSGATVIIRPDSGNPAEVVLKTLQLLDKEFGSQLNRKGFKVLNNVRVIQGDGIDEDSIHEILNTFTQKGFSATNVAFGMGGALLQKLDRDTQKFAYKCSEATVNGVRRGVRKDPITDSGKASKEGRLDLVWLNDKFKTVSGEENLGSVMREVFNNGKILKEYTLDEVRANATKCLMR